MNITRFFAVFCVLMLVFCASCSNSSSNTKSKPSGNAVENTTDKQFCLMFNENDSVNPYKAVSQNNKQLITLMYDPLVRLDCFFQPVFIIADSIEYNGKKCTVTLKDIVFSDGSPLTAKDVVYSETLAKESDTVFASELGEVSDCKASDDKTVVFTLKKADPYFANLLDFPIIKSGSDKMTDKNKIALPPIGSGRYVFDTTSETLKINTLYYGEKPGIVSIGLINSPDSEVRMYNIEAGNVSIVSTDLADGYVPSFAGTAVKTNLNNIVYLGANNYYGKMSNKKMRYAVSAALNRNEICADAFFNYALPANGLFHPLWEDTAGMQSISPTADLQNLVAYFEDLGYNNKNTDGFYINSSEKVLSLTLVYSEDNDRHAIVANTVKKQLESAGISVTVNALGRSKYIEAITYGNYDLFIAEVKLFNNMNVSELVTHGGSLAYEFGRPSGKTDEPETTEAPKEPGDDGKESESGSESAGMTLDSAIAGFYTDRFSVTDIINAFNDEMPIIPLCYRCGVTVCDAKLGVTQISSVNDPFFGIENIK